MRAERASEVSELVVLLSMVGWDGVCGWVGKWMCVCRECESASKGVWGLSSRRAVGRWVVVKVVVVGGLFCRCRVEGTERRWRGR